MIKETEKAGEITVDFLQKQVLDLSPIILPKIFHLLPN